MKKSKKKIMLLMFLLSVFSMCFGATIVAKAETIQNSTYTINDDTLRVLDNLYSNSEYSNYIYATTRVYESNYRYVYYYYACLTNDDLDVGDPLNISSNCDILYTYNSTDGSITKSKNKITIVNSNYYSNFKEKMLMRQILYMLCGVAILVFVYYLLSYAFTNWFSSRGGGFKYENV